MNMDLDYLQRFLKRNLVREISAAIVSNSLKTICMKILPPWYIYGLVDKDLIFRSNAIFSPGRPDCGHQRWSSFSHFDQLRVGLPAPLLH